MSKLFTTLSMLLLAAASVFGAGSVGKLQGAAVAVEAPDERLAIAAGKLGWTLEKAKAIAARDSDLHVSADNRLFYACKFLPAAITAPSGGGSGSAAAIVGVDTTPFTTPPMTVNATTAFQLHSRPGAARVLYLDFKGHTTPSGMWGPTAIVTPAFKLAGTTSPTDQANLDAIRDIWLHVSEDFSPWDIDVTTELPAITKRGQRCVIGGSEAAWVGVTGVMGIAHIGSFGGLLTGSDDNNFVFIDDNIPSTNPTTSNYEVTIECVAHEVGHTLGLNHWGEDSTGTGAPYTVGHSVTGFTGVTSVCPIMGNSGFVGWPSACNLNQWSKGDYAHAKAATSAGTQDDVAIISTYATHLTSTNGTLASATVVSGTSITAGGVIADSTDVNLMKITPGVGVMTLTATPHLKYRNYNGNLKIGLSLLNSAGTTVAKAYSTSGMGATLTYSVPTGGTYYIKINGLGYDPSKTGPSQVWSGTGVAGTVVGTSAGFTNYGSLGRWGLVGTWQPLVQLPTANITSDKTGGVRPVTVAFNGSASSDPDGFVAGYSWNFGDPGSGAANTSTLANPTHTYSGAPGTYTASLVVTDNQGNASSPANKTITVSGTPLPPSIRLASMTATWVQTTNVEVTAVATIQVVDQYGQAIKNAIVNVRVTGSSSGLAAARTDANGIVTISMPKQRSNISTNYTFTVTSLSLTGYAYDVAHNLPFSSSVAISR
jgi:PKD repeat protein